MKNANPMDKINSRLIILHGPNLNLLGQREPEIYGYQSEEQILRSLREAFPANPIDLYQTNHEGQFIDWIHEFGFSGPGLIINPGAWAHTSLAIADAIRSIKVPVLEVHLSQVFAREAYRKDLMVAPSCKGLITGFGMAGYRMAASWLLSDSNTFFKDPASRE